QEPEDKKKQQLQDAQLFLKQQHRLQIGQLQISGVRQKKNKQKSVSASNNSMLEIKTSDGNSLIFLDPEEPHVQFFDVIQANNTRWNSTLYCFERLIYLKNAIQTLMTTLSNESNYANVRRRGAHLSELYLDADEWELISQLVRILYPYEVVTKLVCTSNYCSADLVYPTIYELIKKSHEILNMIQNPEAVKIGKIILEDSEMRWPSPNNALVFASFFDLRFKNLNSYQREI
ncbi:5114_t:CDS:2, partial [Entrophospora sp. SA101]